MPSWDDEFLGGGEFGSNLGREEGSSVDGYRGIGSDPEGEEAGFSDFDEFDLEFGAPFDEEEWWKNDEEKMEDDSKHWPGHTDPQPPPFVRGCMDPTAGNYNPRATIDDGTCEPKPKKPADVRGCMDSTATNYNPLATIDDGTCETVIVDPIVGCMDPNAKNYNPQAEIDCGNCE